MQQHKVIEVIVPLQWPPMNGPVKHAHKARRSLDNLDIDPKALNKNSFHTMDELSGLVEKGSEPLKIQYLVLGHALQRYLNGVC